MMFKAISLAILLLVSWESRWVGAAEPASKALFAYGAINAYMTSTWIAKEQGFFRKHNVDVQPVFIIATQAAQAMLAGEVQVGLIGPTHIVNAVAAGGDMVMIMGNQNKVRYQLVAHPSIKRPEDLKGKKVGIGASMAGLATLAAIMSLEHLGISPRRDNVTLLPTGPEPARLAAVKAGTTQATVIAPEISQAAIAEGFPVLVDMAKLNIPFQASGLAVLRKTLRSEPVMLDRVGRATVDAIRFIGAPSNKNVVVQSVMKNLKISDQAKAETVYGDLVEDLPRSICPTVPGVRSIMKLMTEFGINPKASQVKVEDVVDLTLCKKWGGEAS
ncbi:MAG TPA: ABC transporter substrate-binding protein [Candidatus Binatia bacterium]|nr:ABC transporter substrate-binding protein [Candidatus Binatia bacterium]